MSAPATVTVYFELIIWCRHANLKSI